MMVGFGLVWILVLAALACVVFMVARKPGGGRATRLPRTGDSAEEILRQRFARGEIDRDEYESLLRDLRR